MHPTCTASAPHKYGQIVEQDSGDRLSEIKPDYIDSTSGTLPDLSL